LSEVNPWKKQKIIIPLTNAKKGSIEIVYKYETDNADYDGYKLYKRDDCHLYLPSYFTFKEENTLGTVFCNDQNLLMASPVKHLSHNTLEKEINSWIKDATILCERRVAINFDKFSQEFYLEVEHSGEGIRTQYLYCLDRENYLLVLKNVEKVPSEDPIKFLAKIARKIKFIKKVEKDVAIQEEDPMKRGKLNISFNRGPQWETKSHFLNLYLENSSGRLVGKSYDMKTPPYDCSLDMKVHSGTYDFSMKAYDGQDVSFSHEQDDGNIFSTLEKCISQWIPIAFPSDTQPIDEIKRMERKPERSSLTRPIISFSSLHSSHPSWIEQDLHTLLQMKSLSMEMDGLSISGIRILCFTFQKNSNE